MLKRIRLFFEVMRARFPGAVAIALADDIYVSTSSFGNVQITLWINDERKRNVAYQAVSAWYAGKYF